MAPQEYGRSGCWRRTLGYLILIGGLFIQSQVLIAADAGDLAVLIPADISALSPSDAVARIDALRTEIAFYDELYFKKSAPVITDAAYDQLKREFAALERQFPAAVREDGVVAGVGDDRAGSFATYRHRMRMLSLNKSYTEKELRAFDARLMKQLGRRELDYVVEPKFDGLAISVTFEKGEFVRAVTRGNGVEGDEVTTNVRTIHGLPQILRALRSVAGELDAMPDLIELRGEVFISPAEFERINRDRVRAGEVLYSNPRNLAAGTLKHRDAEVVAQRNWKSYSMAAARANRRKHGRNRS